VGLTTDADQAVVLNTESRTLIAVQFDAHGVSDLVDETLVRDVGAAALWLNAAQPDLLWTHPRYD
jgi:hypothetical protein